MNVWVRRTRKKANCYYCGKEIETGTYQIVCQYFMPVGGGKTWKKRMLFHAIPNCWLDRAIAELANKPVLETRGRKANNLTDDVKEQRNKILRRRASILQRLEKEMRERMRPVKLLHLTEMVENLKEEIMGFGGVPKSWN